MSVNIDRFKNLFEPESIAIIGASIGANAALNYAAADPEIAAVALLSPGFDYHGILMGDAMVKYGSRPVFMAASQDDLPAYGAVLELPNSATGKKMIKTYAGTLHGTKMFGADPIAKPLIEFLKESLGK